MQHEAMSFESSPGRAVDTTPGGDLQQLRQLAGGLVERIGSVRRQFDQLKIELDERPRLEGKEPLGLPLPDTEADMRGTQISDAPTLAALNLALIGSSRAETRQHLLRSFAGHGEDRIDEILHATFGPPDSDQQRKRRFARFRH